MNANKDNNEIGAAAALSANGDTTIPMPPPTLPSLLNGRSASAAASCVEVPSSIPTSTCPWCGNQFKTHQGRNAHLRFCKEKPTNTATAAFGKTTSTATAIPKEVQDNLGPYRTSKSTTTKKNTTTATSTLAAAASGVDTSAQNTQRKKQKTVPINHEQKQACHDFFNEQKYQPGTKLPTTGTRAAALFVLIDETGLTRPQVKRQLQVWKGIKFENHGKQFPRTPSQIKEIIKSHMIVEQEEFIFDVIEKMMTTTTGIIGKTTWHTMAATEHPFYNIVLPLMVKEDQFKRIFISILDGYASIGAEVYPEKTMDCKSADYKFNSKRIVMANDKFDDFFQFILDGPFDEHLVRLEEVEDEDEMQDERFKTWKRFYTQLEEKLHYDWCRTSYVNDLPPVTIDLNCKVDKYASEILYYTAGCLFKKIENIAKKKQEFRDMSAKMITLHSIGYEDACHEELPVDITKKREQKNKLHFVSADFFSFICSIENTFIANANIGMMMAYTDGSLFDGIRLALGSNQSAFELFSEKLGISSYFCVDDQKLLYNFLLTKFKNIRGRWFVNAIRGQKPQKDTHTTRKSVAITAEIALAKGEARAEMLDNLARQSKEEAESEAEVIAAKTELYKIATSNVDNIDYDSDDNDDDNDNNMNDFDDDDDDDDDDSIFPKTKVL